MLLMGKLTISMSIFHSDVKLPEGNMTLSELEHGPVEILECSHDMVIFLFVM